VDNPIRVIVDGTSLGFGAESGVGRAGIFRVAQGLLAEALRRRDLDVHVAAIDSYFGEIQLSRYERRPGAALGPHRVQAWYHPTVPRDESIALLDGAALAGEASLEGRRAMAMLTLMNRVARPAATVGPFDVYHSLRHALAPAERVSARARVLFVHDLIPLLFPELSGDGFATALRGILGSVDVARDWIICASECTRSDLCRRLAIDPARVFVTPLAADGALFHPVDDPGPIRRIRHRYGIGDRPYLLSVSTIEPRKNLAHLIRCFSRLVRDPTVDDGLRLVLAGATGWKAAGVFQAFEGAPAIRERVIFTGYVPDDDLAGLYSGADAFVYPSRYEGFGLPVLEAMRCGVPVVTSTGGALPEVVGQAALLVDPDDADGLVQAMRVARRDVALATAGRARAAGFTWARTVDLTVAAYRFMLSRSDRLLA